MAESWKEYVKQEFMKADSEFVEKMPVNSIDLSTFGLISEATSFVLVRIDGDVHLRPLPGGLASLRDDLKNSPGPGGSFDLDNAVKALTQFADEWEKMIKKKNKWEKTLELAREEDEIMSQEVYEQETKTESSLLGKLRGLFG
ncbi:MAG: hypothetical protein ACLFN7_00935 [Candidatus Acetothermia bacterium]